VIAQSIFHEPDFDNARPRIASEVVREVAKIKSSYRRLGIPATVVLLLRAQKTRVLESALAWGSEYSRQPMFLFPGMAGVAMLPMSLTLRLRQFRRRQNSRQRAAGTWLAPLQRDHADLHRHRREGHASRDGALDAVITLQLYADQVSEKDRAAARPWQSLKRTTDRDNMLTLVGAAATVKMTRKVCGRSLRLSPELGRAVDKWAALQSDEPNRSEAIRRVGRAAPYLGTAASPSQRLRAARRIAKGVAEVEVNGKRK
jgi:hypothetical protein